MMITMLKELIFCSRACIEYLGVGGVSCETRGGGLGGRVYLGCVGGDFGGEQLGVVSVRAVKKW